MEMNATEVTDEGTVPPPPQHLRRRLISGFAIALTIAISAYLLINKSSSDAIAFGSFWFLAILPAFLCAFICYIGDPDADRNSSFYWWVPVGLVAVVIFGSAFFLREGVICLVMLSPIWLAFGWIGAFIMRNALRRHHQSGTFRSTLLLFPLLIGMVEHQIPMPHEGVMVTRQIVVNATPAQIWPYAVSNPHIAQNEGRWTFSQNIVGLPRPRATILRGTGIGAVRTALWGDHINFDERITQWQPGRILGWDFAFTNTSLQDYTDKHIAPDGQFLTVDSGDYTLKPLSPTQTLLTLHTHYIAKTHVNPYAELWGELFLGDVEDNILTIIKQRAETYHGMDR